SLLARSRLSCIGVRPGSDAEGRSPEACDGAERVQELGAEGLGALQLDIRLAGVACELGGEAKDPAPQPLGLSPAPAPGESGGADDALSPNSWDTQREAVRVCSRRNSAGDFIPSAECGATSL